MKLKLLATAALAATAISCNNTQEGPLSDASVYLINCTIEDFEPDDVTKVVAEQSGTGISSVWTAGDVIGVFPDKGGDQVTFTVADGAGTSNCTFDGHGWGLLKNTEYSAYYPYNVENYGNADARKNIIVSYSGQSQSAKDAFDVGAFDYLACTNAVPSFAGEPSGTCTFNFGHLGALIILDITFPKAAVLSKIELAGSGNPFTKTGTVDLSQVAVAIAPASKSNNLSLDLSGMAVAAGETVHFYMMAAPADLTSSALTIRAVTTSGAEMGKSLSSSYCFEAGKAYAIAATLENLETDGLPRAIHDGDRILVTNETVERFLSEVRYPVKDYSYTSVLEYPVAPGEADVPPSFTIRWYQDVTEGSIAARLWEEGWSREVSLDPGEGRYWTVTNMRPNAHYHYEVRSSGGVLTEGEFETYGHLHQVFFDSKVRNARDLGGWETTDGKTVKYRKLYRGGKMSPKHLSEAGKQDLLAEGIRAQLDLRGDDRISSCAFGSQYSFYAPGLTAGYLTMLGDSEKTKACFEFVVDCLRADKPVYFHCSAGRDRTGTMAMLLLGVLGVPEGDISQEYELSLFAPVGWSITESEITNGSSVQTRLKSYKTTTTHFWNLANGGSFAQGVENYLVSIGVNAVDINDFKSLMLE